MAMYRKLGKKSDQRKALLRNIMEKLKLPRPELRRFAKLQSILLRLQLRKRITLMRLR